MGAAKGEGGFSNDGSAERNMKFTILNNFHLH